MVEKETAKWLPVPQALALLGEFFKTEATLRYHICRRGKNGLLAADAVRETPLGLRLNPRRVKQWALGELQRVA